MKRLMLQAKRKSVGLTQAQLAEKSHLSEVSYQRIEYGTQRPTVDTAILIAEALKIKSFKEFKKLFGAGAPEE